MTDDMNTIKEFYISNLNVAGKIIFAPIVILIVLGFLFMPIFMKREERK